jgi:HTH-type transcriptional regulator, competence development regulator
MPLWDGEGVSGSGNSLYSATFSYNPPGEQVDFGTYIAELREKKGFSLRELEKKAGDLSHVYIWRLEKGDRDAPSAETLDKLGKALEVSEREWELALLLLKCNDINDDLFRIARERNDLSISDIEPVATMSFRGNRPTDEAGWLRLIDLVKNF